MIQVNSVNASSLRIVLIDNNEDDKAQLRRLLLRGSERRYIFLEAQTGELGVALVLAAKERPDCVLLDYNLPDMDALDVLSALIGADGLPVCPIVVLTGGAVPQDRRALLHAGAQDYVGKDWLTSAGLTWVVENAIARMAMARQLSQRDETLRKNEKALFEADQRKDEFISVLAHELRNPLAPIRTGLQVLRQVRDGTVIHETLDVLERQLVHMTHLIDDLMDISRVTNGKLLLRLEGITAQKIVGIAVESTRSIIESRGQKLVIKLSEQSLWMQADSVRIAQVISNLLNNASKYSLQGGIITLSASRNGVELVISVSDQGIGIPGNMLEQVFDMFAQVNRSLDRSEGGLGIGLALVRRLVHMHGGTVVAESPGLSLGSTFTVRLPLATEVDLSNKQASSEKEQPVRQSKIGRVLIVDDNKDAANLLASLLQLSGHETCTGYGGLEALRLADEFSPQVIFLDIGMPDLNGYEVARRLRAAPSSKNAMLIALTGWGSEADRSKSQDAGFDVHLTKPVDPATIEDLMAKWAAIEGASRQSDFIRLSTVVMLRE